MPYKSEARRRFMHAKHPGVAARWDKKYPAKKKLPNRVRRRVKHETMFRELDKELQRR